MNDVVIHECSSLSRPSFFLGAPQNAIVSYSRVILSIFLVFSAQRNEVASTEWWASVSDMTSLRRASYYLQCKVPSRETQLASLETRFLPFDPGEIRLSEGCALKEAAAGVEKCDISVTV